MKVKIEYTKIKGKVATLSKICPFRAYLNKQLLINGMAYLTKIIVGSDRCFACCCFKGFDAETFEIECSSDELDGYSD